VSKKPALGAWVRRPLLARITLLVGLFCIFSQVSGALHWALVEHVRCAEHGDWVHEGEAHAEVEAHAEGEAHAEASPEPSSEPGLQAPGADEHGHDHCLYLADRRDPSLPSAALALIDSRVGGWSAAAPGERDAVASALAYELAPKTSPPG
jgi:hypothetical protein